MKDKKSLSAAFLGGAAIVFVAIVLWGSPLQGKAEVNEPYVGLSLGGATEITCTFPRLVSAFYSEGNIKYSLPEKEKQPFVLTFSGLDKDTATLKSLDSTQTISEVQIAKVADNEDVLTYVNTNSFSYVETYTIFKKQGVAIFTHGINLLGSPSGTMGIGTCAGY